MWIVHYHGDGGQCCIPKIREFNKKEDAEYFADQMRNEKGHTCLDSVKIQNNYLYCRDY